MRKYAIRLVPTGCFYNAMSSAVEHIDRATLFDTIEEANTARGTFNDLWVRRAEIVTVCVKVAVETRTIED